MTASSAKAQIAAPSSRAIRSARLMASTLSAISQYMGIWAIAITGMDSSAGGLVRQAAATRAMAAAISWQTLWRLLHARKHGTTGSLNRR